MALPIPANNSVSGNGDQNFKAVVMGWIREEIGRATQGGAGLHVDGATGNLIIDRGEVQSGNYTPGSAGWALQPGGGAEFSGAVTIDGSLTISSGLLQGITYLNTAIGTNFTQGWAIPGAETTLVTTSIAVPAGFTAASVIVESSISFLNTAGAGGTYVFGRAIAGASLGSRMTSYLPDPYAVTVSASGVFEFTGLSGGTITVGTNGWAQSAKPAVPSNIASVSAVALFTR